MKIKLSRKHQNKMFKYRQWRWFTYYEITDDPNKRTMEMHEYLRLPTRIITILLSPLAIFVGGIPAMNNLIRECLSKEVIGADTIDREKFYKEFKELLK